MWRRYGDALYTLMTLAIFGFETIALGALSLVFLLGAAAGIASTPIEEILLAVVTSTASALALLGLYLLSYHFISNLRDRWQADQVDKWTEWWIGLALAGPEVPVEATTASRMPSTGVAATPATVPSRNDRLSPPSAIVSKPKTARAIRV